MWYLRILREIERDSISNFRGIWSSGRFAFWSGKEEDEVSRKWLACTCDMCGLDKHSDCPNKHLFLVDSIDRNEV